MEDYEEKALLIRGPVKEIHYPETQAPVVVLILQTFQGGIKLLLSFCQRQQEGQLLTPLLGGPLIRFYLIKPGLFEGQEFLTGIDVSGINSLMYGIQCLCISEGVVEASGGGDVVKGLCQVLDIDSLGELHLLDCLILDIPD